MQDLHRDVGSRVAEKPRDLQKLEPRVAAGAVEALRMQES